MGMRILKVFFSLIVVLGILHLIVLKLNNMFYPISLPGVFKTFINNFFYFNIRNLLHNGPPLYLLGGNNWKPVDRENTTYVVSAFSSDVEKTVLIIGVTSKNSGRFYCQLWTKSTGDTLLAVTLTEAVVEILPEGAKNKRYKAAIFKCTKITNHPTFVSLVTNARESPFNFIKVKNSTVPYRYRHTFTTCSGSLRLQNKRIFNIIEWIELNRVLGVDKFILYNYTTSKGVADVLKMYTKRGIIDLVQWHIPLDVGSGPVKRISTPNQIHQYGQIASMHDCLLRCKHESKFLINLDIDEFIIPHSPNTTTLAEMITTVDQNYTTSLFRSTIFRKDWALKENCFVDVPYRVNFVTFQNIYHERFIYEATNRSKYITRTNSVDNLMTHFVPDKMTYVFPTNRALLHHYRAPLRKPATLEREFDATVPNKYGQILAQNALYILQMLSTNNKMDLKLWKANASCNPNLRTK